ncbi:NB-ARC domains-containing protein [Artemisia annua]|uniref:NB-ARC domains-containing protein n=1 Tax=Artemisia annua TaxID=35608 RepID=A0A2U1QBJ0_ARTAN|nr:NB-ARC domains-containing protein [Artemisia annua]
MTEAIVSSTVSKVVDLLFGKVIKEIKYIRSCTENVEKFKAEVEMLKVMRGEVQQQIVIAKDKGDNLKFGVEEWVKKADTEISKAEDFLNEEANAKKTCFKIGLCGNWHTLYHYGKKANKNVPSLLDLQVRGRDYVSCASVDTPAVGPLEVYPNKILADIATQNSALGAIIEAIKDENKQIIGIYGIGGVGKTTLAKKVSARVKHLFAAVAFTTVSQTVSVEKIQKDIGNATKRIMKGEKILIILDDVWERLDLEKLCIPCGINHMNCKILLTSRSESVCEKMNAHKICLNTLPIKEAWILFNCVVGDEVERDADLKRVAIKVAEECGGLPLFLDAVGNALQHKTIEDWENALHRLQEHAPTRVDPEIGKALTCDEVERDADLKRVAIKVAEECGGLPLFLDAVGNALQHKTIEDWENALHRLQEHAPTRVDPEIGKALTCLKLSYDFLDNEARLCFLLCSMFPEDEEILLENLVLYAVGLAKFHGLKSMEDARQRVKDAVKILTSSGLLLNLDDKTRTKMHDVVRDVALSIASQGDGKNRFLVEAKKGLTEWLPRKNELESYTGISLWKNKISKLPNYELHLPHLDIFLIPENDEFPMFSDELIQGIKKVKVLDMSWCMDQPLPQSFKFLTNLRMLDLQGNKSLHDISILAEMQDLEILILDMTGIKEIPQEIGQLVNLRRLSVIHCQDLYHIAPGVISKLWRLEELMIGLWVLDQGIYECIVEIMNLSNLTYLALHVPRFDVIPEDFDPRKLKGFVIQIGGYLYYTANLKCRHLGIETDYADISFLKWNKQLIKASPITELNSIENLNNLLPNLYHEGFNELEHIKLFRCPNMSCLVDTANWDQFHSSNHLGEDKFFGKLKHLSLEYLDSLEVLWNCPDQYLSLSNLVTLQIDACDKLVKLFPVSVAQGLVNLQNLTIDRCGSLEEVIWDGDEETSKSETEHSEYIMFRSLAKIHLYVLKRLERFYSGNSTIKYPSLVDVEFWYCPSMKIWGPGIHETPKLKFVNSVQLDGPDATINYAVNKIYETWKKLWEEEEEDTSSTGGFGIICWCWCAGGDVFGVCCWAAGGDGDGNGSWIA